jgi:hypothetical protein
MSASGRGSVLGRRASPTELVVAAAGLLALAAALAARASTRGG